VGKAKGINGITTTAKQSIPKRKNKDNWQKRNSEIFQASPVNVMMPSFRQ
jgi:hypothetical protein